MTNHVFVSHLVATASTSIVGPAANPTSSSTSAVLTIIDLVLGFVPLVAVAFIIFSGFLWMTSHENEERVGAAKVTMTWAVISVIIAGLSWVTIHFFWQSSQNVTGTTLSP